MRWWFGYVATNQTFTPHSGWEVINRSMKAVAAVARDKRKARSVRTLEILAFPNEVGPINEIHYERLGIALTHMTGLKSLNLDINAGFSDHPSVKGALR